MTCKLRHPMGLRHPVPRWRKLSIHCNTMKITATHCNILLQHTAHRNTLQSRWQQRAKRTLIPRRWKPSTCLTLMGVELSMRQNWGDTHRQTHTYTYTHTHAHAHTYTNTHTPYYWSDESLQYVWHRWEWYYRCVGIRVIHTHVHAHTCAYMCTHTHAKTHTHTHTYKLSHTHKYEHIHTHAPTHAHTYTHIHRYTHADTLSHTHTRMSASCLIYH